MSVDAEFNQGLVGQEAEQAISRLRNPDGELAIGNVVRRVCKWAGEGACQKTCQLIVENGTEDVIAEAFAEHASSKGYTPAQLAIAWVLGRGTNIIPIPGTKRRKYLIDNAGAVDINLTSQDFNDIESLLAKYPNIGDRYNESNYRFTDNS